MFPTMRDPRLEARFRRDGWVVADCLDPDEVDELRSIYERFHPEPGRGFEGDIQTPDPGVRAELTDAVLPLGQKKVDEVLDDHRIFAATFFAKWPDEDSALVIHRDWTYVDERRFRSVSFWLALDDVSSELDNGPLQVLSGSHRFIEEYRGARTPAWHWRCEDEVRAHFVEVEVRAGQVVVLDNALVHASGPNRTDRLRLALTCIAAPRAADLIHAVAVGEDQVRLIRCDERFFIDHTPDGLIADPPEANALGTFPRVRRALDADGLDLAPEIVEWAGRPLERPPLGPSAPPEPTGGPVERAINGVLAGTHRSVAAATAGQGPFVGPEVLPWLPSVEAAWPAVRDEWDAATTAGIVRRAGMRHVFGDDLGTGERWGAVLLRVDGRWLSTAADRFPATVAALEAVPDLEAAFFSVLDPGVAIAPHRGPCNGVLRVHLGVVVEADEGDCVLCAGGEKRSFAEGRAVAFDDTFEHTADNFGLAPRVTLMLEVVRPLPLRTRWRNDATRRLLRLHPHHGRATTRAEALDRALNA